jgi:hypothetical protein
MLTPAPRRVSITTLPAVVALVWLAAAIAAVSINAATGRHDTLCLFRTTTGLPCPTCGATRATLALVHAEWWAALAHNPLVTLAWPVLFAWVILRFGLGRRLSITTSARGRHLLAGALLLAVLLNWAYLIGMRAG